MLRASGLVVVLVYWPSGLLCWVRGFCGVLRFFWCMLCSGVWRNLEANCDAIDQGSWGASVKVLWTPDLPNPEA